MREIIIYVVSVLIVFSIGYWFGCFVDFVDDSKSKPKTFEERKPIPHKPFYVYDKVIENDNYQSFYRCVDKNGVRFWFNDVTSKYSVGDSIK